MTIYLPETFKTSGSVMPAVNFQSSLSPESATIGTRGVSALSEGLGTIGKALVKTDVDALNKAFDLRIQDGINKLNEYGQNLKSGNRETGEKGYSSYFGEQIFNSKTFEGQSLGTFYNAQFQKKINEINEALPPLARERFLQKTQEPQLIFNNNLTSWENQQTQVFNIDLGNKTIYQGQNLLKNASTPEEINFSIQQIQQGSEIIQNATGKSNPKEISLIVSDGISGAIQNNISNNNYIGAQQLYKQYGKNLDPSDRMKLNNIFAKVDEQNRDLYIQEYTNLEGYQSIEQNSLTSVGIFQNVVVPIEGGVSPTGQALVSPKGAIGISQIMPETAKEMSKELNIPFDEERLKSDRDYNLLLGQAYFDKMFKRFGDPLKAIVAYNGGPGAVLDAEKKAKEFGRTDPNSWQDFVETEEGQGYLQKGKEILNSLSNKKTLVSENQFVSQTTEKFKRQNPDYTKDDVDKVTKASKATYANMRMQDDALQDDLLSRIIPQAQKGTVGQPAPLDQTLIAQLSPENKLKVQKIVDDITSGKTVITKADVYNDLWGNPNLPNINLNNFVGDVSPDGLAQLKKRQEDMRGKDVDQIRWNDETISRIITQNTNLKQNSMEFINLRNQIADDIRQVQLKTGKPFSGDEVQKIAMLATSKVVYQSTGLFGSVSVESKEAKKFKSDPKVIQLSPSEIETATTFYKAKYGKDPTPEELKSYVIDYKKGLAQ